MRIRAIGITSAIVILCGTMLAIASGPGNPPGLTVVGNTLRDSNNIVVLHGVNRAGTEYACSQGWGVFDTTINVTNDDVEVPFMRSWGMNTVTIPLHEHCWLNINGAPADYSGANYINAIAHEVATLEANGIYPVLALFLEGPGTTLATSQQSMPDNDHAPLFWQSVANTFKTDPKVIFRLIEEPRPRGNTDDTAAWTCWNKGTCSTTLRTRWCRFLATLIAPKDLRRLGCSPLSILFAGQERGTLLHFPARVTQIA
jgi:Cellulase (glycosyl hydrolase family 5)